MTTLDLPGYWEGDIRPDGGYVAARLGDAHLSTHLGTLVCPDVPRYPRITTVGPLKVAAQGAGRTREWVGGTDWLIHRESCGAPGPVLYDRSGQLHISDCSGGAEGYHHIAPDGRLVWGNQVTVRAGSELRESTDLGDGLYVGQGPQGGCWAQLPDGYREIGPGLAMVVRATRVGDDLAIYWYEPDVPHQGSATAHLRWVTVAELRAWPAKATSLPPVPSEPPPPPVVTPPVAPAPAPPPPPPLEPTPEPPRPEEPPVPEPPPTMTQPPYTPPVARWPEPTRKPNIAKLIRDILRAIGLMRRGKPQAPVPHPQVPPENPPVDQVPPSQPAPEPIALTRLAVEGRHLNVFLRGITSFKLLHHYIHDRPQYERVVTEIVGLGFTCVRVLTSCRHMFHLDEILAQNALTDFLEDTRERGLYVSAVAVADSASWSGWREHAERVARIIEHHDNALYELCNEHYHGTQDAALHDADDVQRLFDAIRPACVGTTSAASLDEDLHPQGDVVTRHLDRGRDRWNMVRRVRELLWVSEMTGKPAINWEPIGAGEHDQPGRRLADSDIYLAFGVLARIFGVPTVFHCEDGLLSNMLRPGQRQCAGDFLWGTRVVPDDQRLVYKNATFHDGPVKSFSGGAVRVYSGIHGGQGITIVLGRTPDTVIEWQHGWSITETLIDRPSVAVYRIGA